MRALSLLVLLLAGPAFAADPAPLSLLFLGDDAGHKPAERFKLLAPALKAKGVALTYTDKVEDLNPATLNTYDGLVVYANVTKISPEQEKALLDYVAAGKGFVPLHCASYCFLNSPAYISLVGAQFRSHGTGTFAVENVKPDHAIMKGYPGFTSWDETYVHHKHNETDRTVLEVRTQGELKEPWTWVRTQGKGRVFYTAWGHDARTFGNPGFHNLVERGIRWACGQDPALAGVPVAAAVPAADFKPEMTAKRTDVKPFEYVEAKVPLYVPKGPRKQDQANKMQKPLDVEESKKHFVTPKGFEVRTFVTETQLGGKPLTMAWDERGRLFVALTVDYPNELQKEGEGRDKIVVCEDADGDGVCDTVTTFAEKLSIPTSILPFRGGILVHQAPHTLFLKDTDGDGKADVRQVLITGWGTRDTHAGPSNLRYGFDNWVYGIVGYSGFNGEVAGEKFTFRQGLYRFKVEPVSAVAPASGGRQPPDTNAPPAGTAKDQGADAPRSPGLVVTKFEFLRSTSNNSWGVGFSEDGQLFGSTANGCPLVHMPIPNRYYEKVKGLTPEVLRNIAADNHMEPITDKVRQVDWHGGFTAAAGCSLYTARTYPKEYWNRVSFICEPTGHLVAAMVLEPNGTTYKAKYGWNLLASDDEWSAPIQAEVGPDGQVWVIDWYNFIVQHNPTPQGFTTGKGGAYEIPLRDKTRGRIYRVVYTGPGAKPEPRVDLKDATAAKLVETLAHPNMGWRQHAQRLLVERGDKGVMPALVKLIEGKDADGAVHALRTLHGLGAEGGAVAAITAACRHESAAVRLAALASFPLTGVEANRAIFHLIFDDDMRVRLAAHLAIADRAGSERPGEEFAGGLGWKLREIAGHEWGSPDGLLIAASTSPGAFLYGVQFYAVQGPEKVALLEAVARQHAASGGDRYIAVILHYFSNDWTLPRDNPKAQTAVINGWIAGWPAGKPLTMTDEMRTDFERIMKFTEVPPSRLLKLAQVWQLKGFDAQLAELSKALLATAADAKADDAARIDAAKQVIEFRPADDATAAALLAAVTPQSTSAFAAGIFEALGASKSSTLAAAVVGKLKDVPAAARPAALRLVLGRADSATAFLDAVEAGKVRFDVLALDQKTALAAHPDKLVAERARKLLALGGGLPNADRQKVIDELKFVAAKAGNVDAGKKVFTTHCAKCHKYGTEGAQIGPDLTGFGTHPKEEILVAVLDPSRSVEGNYKAYRATTADGRVVIGLLASESKTAVELLDAEGKRHPLQRDNLDELKETDKSLMPEGFEKQAKPEELADLLEFLTQKGKFVPLSLDKVATVTSVKGMFYSEDAAVERLDFGDWKPVAFDGVPFVLTDPKKGAAKNVILLNSTSGTIPKTMPKAVTVPYSGPAKAVHLLGGVGGWAAQTPRKGGVSLVVRFHFADGKTEDHELRDGVEVADYIRKVDVPGSKFAFGLKGGQQVRYLSVTPTRAGPLTAIEFVKGPDRTAPLVLAVTVETP